MSVQDAVNRQPSDAVEVDQLFLRRWSPRSFSARPLPAGAVASLLEASRWAPSCFNEQPWFFVYADDPDGKSRILDLLVETNRAWARRAPLLMVVFARRTFERTGKENRWSAFDAGSAWMSLALQATQLGIATHAMGGFDEKRALTELGVDGALFEAMAVIAAGYRDQDLSSLSEALVARESPGDRKSIHETSRKLLTSVREGQDDSGTTKQ